MTIGAIDGFGVALSSLRDRDPAALTLFFNDVRTEAGAGIADAYPDYLRLDQRSGLFLALSAERAQGAFMTTLVTSGGSPNRKLVLDHVGLQASAERPAHLPRPPVRR